MVDAKEEELKRFYARYNPENVSNIREIMRKYEGKERQLCMRLYKKYGDYPRIIVSLDGLQNAPNCEEVLKKPEHDVQEKDVPQRSSGPTSGISSEKIVIAPSPMESNTLKIFELYKIPKSDGGPLDFRSTDFDPQLALQQLTIPNLRSVAPLDNLSKARILLPENDANVCRDIKIGVIASKSEKSKRSNAKSQDLVTTNHILNRLADTYITGPFTVLRDCFLKKRRICVVIRRVNSIRGECRGFLLAFDKHMNMVLSDVTELFIPYEVLVDREQTERRENQPKFVYSTAAHLNQRRNQCEKRYVRQLLIRGDNVVMVYEDKSNANLMRKARMS